MKTNLFVAMFFCAFGAVSCNQITDGCNEEKYSSAIVHDFPDSIQAGVIYEQEIEYVIENSCGQFVEFESFQIQNTVEVKVKLSYEGCSCNLEFSQDSSMYSIQQDSSGTYLYKFFLNDGEYDSYQLQVFD